MFKRNAKSRISFAALFLLCAVLAANAVLAAPTDEILDFTVTVDVNEDASLFMTYHIDWKVLDDSIGELEWIDLGVPNGYHENIRPLSGTVDRIEDNGSSLAIWLDRGYGENETVSVEFSMTQDHMYQIDKWVEGETVYTFTPAWFDGMDVDSLTIRWNADKAGAWQPDCAQEDGYLVFSSTLSAGDRYTMSVTYPNDAFLFAEHLAILPATVVEQSHIAHAEATCSTSTANGVAACGKLLPLRVAIKEFARIGIEQVRTHSQACQMSSHLGTGCRHLQRNDVETCGLRA